LPVAELPAACPQAPSSVVKCLWEVFVWGVVLVVCVCVCVVVGGVVLCQCVCVCDLLIFLHRHTTRALPTILTQRQRVLLKEAFSALDTDGDGALGPLELWVAMTSLGYEKHDVDTALEKGDRNKDGELDFDEVRIDGYIYVYIYIYIYIISIYMYIYVYIYISTPSIPR